MFHLLECHLPLPKRLNNPFDYKPHPLVRQAAELVDTRLKANPTWAAEMEAGKMFGVLIVQTEEGAVGFLASFSGLLGGQSVTDFFVPPIYDLLPPDSYFQQEQARISAINRQVADGGGEALSREERKRRSEALQDWLFRQYKCLNARGEVADIVEIFTNYYRAKTLRPEHFERNAASHHIPSGTGDCCAPKLLHYAFSHGLRPLAIGEWTNRQGHRCFRPACQGRCRPLLWHMLQGIVLEPGPQEKQAQEALSQTTILCEDADLVALDKPAGVLSVPGRNGEPSVMDWLRDKGIAVYYPAHRLDQDTSGILLVAKTEDAYRQLQAQFISHRVRKTYLAVLEGEPSVPAEGIISLPLRPDPNDRPRQLVDPLHGKSAVTHYRILSREAGVTHIELQPETGRTHQLRLHCAHPDGLGCPIRGDRLYGSGLGGAERLHLHAAAIDLTHPSTGESLRLSSAPTWESA